LIDAHAIRATFPRSARWLPDVATTPFDSPRHILAVERALRDAGLFEAPPGSNRGATIDKYNRQVGAPLGSPYCCSAAVAWLRDAGLDVVQTASCDELYWWALKTTKFRGSIQEVIPGSLVLYGTGAKDNPAIHVGMIIRLSPLVVSFEANTGVDGKFNREGFAFWPKVLDVRQPPRPILGYVLP
jgi:hypothetical protein